jgi:hypothetical protein
MALVRRGEVVFRFRDQDSHLPKNHLLERQQWLTGTLSVVDRPTLKFPASNERDGEREKSNFMKISYKNLHY